jgi:hypothetical protein
MYVLRAFNKQIICRRTEMGGGGEFAAGCDCLRKANQERKSGKKGKKIKA